MRSRFSSVVARILELPDPRGEVSNQRFDLLARLGSNDHAATLARRIMWVKKALPEEPFWWFEEGFRWLEELFRWLEEGLGWLEEGFRWLEELFRWLEEGFWWLEEGFLWLQELFRWLEEGSWWLEEGFSWLEEGAMHLAALFSGRGKGCDRTVGA